MSVFPTGYAPPTFDGPSDPGGVARNSLDAMVVVIDESTVSAASLIDSLNDTLAATPATWILLIDVSRTASERRVTLDHLLAHARDEDDVVFADEAGENPLSPILKSPSVGPHTLLSYNVVGRPTLLRVTTLRSIGGFSRDAGWAFEHDAYLRLIEAASVFHHVALVLPAGRAPLAFESSHVNADTHRVVASALARRELPGHVVEGALGGVVRWRIDTPSPQPSIDIVIPTRDHVDLLRTCIESIERLTTYQNYDIIILDNDSRDHETLAYFAQSTYRVVACPGSFNYARIVNRGVAQSSADFVVTLNNDTILVTPDWLEQLIALGSLPDVGIVGARLLDGEGHPEHEGFVVAPYPQHVRSGSNYPHDDQFINAVRDVVAVTGAVQLVSRVLWQSLGGMDERLEVVMNDVDLCLRSQLEGRFVVYTPDVTLVHVAGSSRGNLDPIEDRNLFVRRWDIFGSFQDPYFSENVELLGETMYFRPSRRESKDRS